MLEINRINKATSDAELEGRQMSVEVVPVSATWKNNTLEDVSEDSRARASFLARGILSGWNWS